VGPYREALNNWPTIRQGDGHGYWSASTPRGHGYTAGFNRSPYRIVYETYADQSEWSCGYHAGVQARAAVELELGNCPVCGHAAHEGAVCTHAIDPDGDLCCCDRTDPTAALPVPHDLDAQDVEHPDWAPFFNIGPVEFPPQNKKPIPGFGKAGP